VAAIQSSQVSFNEGPTFPDDHPGILAAQSKRTQLKIPLQLVMTAKAGGVDDLPPKQRDNVRETLALNPELTLRFLTDEDCRGFISKNYEPDLLSAFDNEKHGSYRGDICRAAVIAIEGGFYADLDVQFRVPFVKMVDEGTTFMSALDIYCNVLNALFAVEPSSAVMHSVIAAIRDWYAQPGASRPRGSFLGTVTMLAGLKDVVSHDCPGMDIRNATELQRSCGSHHQFRFFTEQRIRCARTATEECPLGRQLTHFDGVRFGLFEPGPNRKLVAWSRFETCSKWGCDERREESAIVGACLVPPTPHPVYHPVQHPVHR